MTDVRGDTVANQLVLGLGWCPFMLWMLLDEYLAPNYQTPPTRRFDTIRQNPGVGSGFGKGAVWNVGGSVGLIGRILASPNCTMRCELCTMQSNALKEVANVTCTAFS